MDEDKATVSVVLDGEEVELPFSLLEHVSLACATRTSSGIAKRWCASIRNTYCR